MTDTGYLIAATLIAAGITWALRSVPFLAVHRLRDMPSVAHLAERLPLGIMVILVMYSIRGLELHTTSEALITTTSMCVTVALHLWRRNAALSIFGGTAVQIALMSSFTA